MATVSGRFVKENVKRMLIKEYIKKQAERAGFGGVTLQRTPMGTQISITVEKPGMMIGHHGQTIRLLQSMLASDFKVDNPQIDIKEAGKDADLNPHIMARKLADALERGWNFRRAAHSTVERIMSAGAKGCEIIIAGKLKGDRHKTAKFVKGNIKFCGETANQWMKKGYSQAKLKAGVIGVTVRIMDPNAVMPDAVRFMDIVAQPPAQPSEGAGQKEEAQKRSKEGAEEKEPKEEKDVKE